LPSRYYKIPEVGPDDVEFCTAVYCRLKESALQKIGLTKCSIWLSAVAASLLVFWLSDSVFDSTMYNAADRIQQLCYNTSKGVRCIKARPRTRGEVSQKRLRVYICLDDLVYILSYGVRKIPPSVAVQRILYAVFFNLAAASGVKPEMYADAWRLAMRVVNELVVPWLSQRGVPVGAVESSPSFEAVESAARGLINTLIEASSRSIATPAAPQPPGGKDAEPGSGSNRADSA